MIDSIYPIVQCGIGEEVVQRERERERERERVREWGLLCNVTMKIALFIKAALRRSLISASAV